jgi:O-antigen chain-terminating methyltransferase
VSTSYVDVDALMHEVRERVRKKRALGVYSDEVEAMLKAPLPGGPALLADDLADALAALSTYVEAEVGYDPRSRKSVVGPAITTARRGVMWLIQWWIRAIIDRQDRINKLVLRVLQDLDRRSQPRLEQRLAKLEEESRRRRQDESAGNLHWEYFAARFSGDPKTIYEQDRRFVDVFRGRTRVLDVGSGRGTFLELMRDEGIGAYGVDIDARLVELCREKGFEVYRVDAETHLRQLRDASIDGAFAAHFAEHIEPGALIEILRQFRLVLQPGSALVFATPNARTLTVGAHTFWTDPSHRRPIPPELFEFLLLVEGFVDVRVETYAASEETQLNEDVDDPVMRENLRYLNDRLFGDRDYAVIGYQPT